MKEKIDYGRYFKNKKITVMGLGLLGRGIGVVKFLAEQGVKLTVTDLKNKKELKLALDELKKFKNIKYVLGEHKLDDFKNRDLIIRAANVPLDSVYIKEAQKNNIPIEMDASLFARLSLATIIGITGTRGKSTVTKIIYNSLKKHSLKNRNVFLGGNIKGIATLPLLKKAKKGDFVILELDSWQLQGFGDLKISPHISVFTNFMPDHLNYYKGDMQHYFDDKANIFKYQNRDDYLVISEQAEREIKKRFKDKIKSKIIQTKNYIPNNWKINLIGEHNKLNIALAVKVLEILGLSKIAIKKGIENYKGEPGRLELIRRFKNIDYYNDTNSTTPDALMAALKTLRSDENNIILIAGGNNKDLDYKKITEFVNKTVKALILIKGTATNQIISYSTKPIEVVDNMKKAFKKAKNLSQKGDIILLSPGAASFGVFKNEYDRGEQFVKLVKQLK